MDRWTIARSVKRDKQEKYRGKIPQRNLVMLTRPSDTRLRPNSAGASKISALTIRYCLPFAENSPFNANHRDMKTKMTLLV